MRPPLFGTLRTKTAQFFSGMYDFGSGRINNGFFPIATNGQAAPPINAVTAETGRVVTPTTALALSSVWSCVWLISDTISTLPFILNKRAGPTFGAPAFGNPLYTVLGATPNAQMSACEFWQVMFASELLWGNGYAKKTVNKNGDCINLDPLRPEFMTPYRDTLTRLIRYKYYSPLDGDGVQDFSSDEIFHFKGRTIDGLVGLSRIQYARNSLGIAIAANEATADTFKNSLRSGGFITSDKFLKLDQRTQFSESLHEFTTGGQKSASIMVLEGGMNFTPLTMNPQDVQLLSSRQFAVEDVCRWYGVPPVLIGHAAAGVTSWGTGIEQLLLGWLSLSLRPLVRRMEQTISRSLIKPVDRQTLYLTIDTDDLLGADSGARAALYSTLAQNGILTRNEIRAMEDRAPIAGGDALTVQSNLIPIDKLGVAPAQPGKADVPAPFGAPA